MSLGDCDYTSTCTDKKEYRSRRGIDAKYVTWGSVVDQAPAEVCYPNDASDDVAGNGPHERFGYREGVLKKSYFALVPPPDGPETCDQKMVTLTFKISLKSNPHGSTTFVPETSDGMMVARPCPPFCGGSPIDWFSRMIRRFFSN